MASDSMASKRRASVRKSPSPPSPTNSNVAPGEELPREVRCEYPSKFCNSHKALKTKGGMHKFCEYHRRKANLNQKRWQQRRRELREQREQDRDKYAARATSATSSSEATVEHETLVSDAPSAKLLAGDAELVALSPSDEIEPFPISDFTTTPPPSRVEIAPMVAPTTNFTGGFNDAAYHSSASGFSVDDDLDVLTTLFFNDTQTNAYTMYNWPAATSYGAPAASINTSGYTMTGPSAAIV